MNLFETKKSAIDTNIFEHLLNPQENVCGHIDMLLQKMRDIGVILIIDGRQRILAEYNDRTVPLFKNQRTDSSKRFLIQYWTQDCKKYRVSVEHSSELIKKIKKVLPQGEGTDAVFVFVVFRCGGTLLTNDRDDIIDEGSKRNARRTKLLRIKERNMNSEILTSKEAFDALPQE